MIKFSPKQESFILDKYDHTFEVCEGSPRSGKTFAATARFAMHVLASRDTSHLVVGYSSEQAYRLIFDGDGFGLTHIFKGFSRVSHDDRGTFTCYLPRWFNQKDILEGRRQS
jgi:Terminase-like family.